MALVRSEYRLANIVDQQYPTIVGTTGCVHLNSVLLAVYTTKSNDSRQLPSRYWHAPIELNPTMTDIFGQQRRERLHGTWEQQLNGTFVSLCYAGFPGSPSLHFENVKINHSYYNVTWDYPRDVGGDDVSLFTLWYREIATNNSIQGKWRNLNTTKTRFHLNLNCCLTYEVTVTAWNRYGHSFFDPNNKARITVLRGMPFFKLFFWSPLK